MSNGVIPSLFLLFSMACFSTKNLIVSECPFALIVMYKHENILPCVMKRRVSKFVTTANVCSLFSEYSTYLGMSTPRSIMKRSSSILCNLFKAQRALPDQQLLSELCFLKALLHILSFLDRQLYVTGLHLLDL